MMLPAMLASRYVPSSIGGGGGIAISDSLLVGPSSYGTTLSLTIPSSMAAGDHMAVVLHNSNGATATNFSSGTWKKISGGTWPSGKEAWLSTSFGSVPGTITVTFDTNSEHYAEVYSASGIDYASSPLSSGNSTTSYDTVPRAHAYTTGTDGSLILGSIDFTGGGVTGGTGQDGAHEWLNLSSGYNISFAGVRATAGSYDATVGPSGAGSSSEYYWLEVGAV